MSSWHLPLMLVWLHRCYYGYSAGVVCCYGYPTAVISHSSCKPGRERETGAACYKLMDCLIEEKDHGLKSDHKIKRSDFYTHR